MNSDFDFEMWRTAALARVETALDGFIDAHSPADLGVAMRYGVLGGGKRLRALLVLVNDVLDYSRLQAHKLVLEQVRFNLRRWLWEVVTPQRIAAQAKGLDLQLQVDESLPQEVVGDPGRLRQIVINLVSNAIKFTNEANFTFINLLPSA